MRIASINSMSCCKPNLSKRANLREAEQPQIQTPIEPSFKGKETAVAGGLIGAFVGALCAAGPVGVLAVAAIGALLGACDEDLPNPGDDDQKDDQNKQIGNNDQK